MLLVFNILVKKEGERCFSTTSPYCAIDGYVLVCPYAGMVGALEMLPFARCPILRAPLTRDTRQAATMGALPTLTLYYTVCVCVCVPLCVFYTTNTL